MSRGVGHGRFAQAGVAVSTCRKSPKVLQPSVFAESLHSACLATWDSTILSTITGPLCPNVCVNNVVFMLYTCFPSEGRGFGYVVGRGCLGDRPPIKTLGTEGTVSFPGRQHIARVVTIHCWEIKRVCVALWGEALGSAHLVSPVFAP